MQCAYSATFRLSMFLMVSFLKINLRIKLQKAQNNYIRFCLNLPPRSHIDPSHFRKNKLFSSQQQNRILYNKHHFKYQNGTKIILMKCLSLYYADIYSTRSQLALNIPLRKTNTWQKSLSFLGPKIWSKVNSSIKNVKTSPSFMHASKKNILVHLKT